MAQFVALDSDVLIFTDSGFCAGGITDGRAPATLLSRGTTLMLRDLFFPDTENAGGDDPLSVEALDQRLRDRVPPERREREPDLAAAFLNGIPHLYSRDQTSTLGSVEVAEHDDHGTLQLGAVTNVFRPAGRMYRRTVGTDTLWFGVASDSLAGVIAPDPGFLSITNDVTALQVRDLAEVSSSYGCGACGACGACGLCTLCAEINLGSMVGTAIAVTALAVLQATERRPQFEAEAVALRRPIAVPLLGALNDELVKLGTLARAVADEFGPDRGGRHDG